MMATVINADVSTGGAIITGDNSGVLQLQTAGTTAVTVGTDKSATFAGQMIIKPIIETTTVTAGAPASTQTYDVLTQAVQYYTSNTSTNWAINLRGNSGTTMDSLLSTGQAVTVAMMATNSGTAYYNTSVQVDGTTSGVTTKWQGGTAPSSGNASAIDVYTYTVVKTGSATYTVFASQTKYA